MSGARQAIRWSLGGSVLQALRIEASGQPFEAQNPSDQRVNSIPKPQSKGPPSGTTLEIPRAASAPCMGGAPRS